MDSNTDKLEFPCLVELFGNNRIAGAVSEHSLGNSVMIRIDVPDTKRNPPFTKFVNPSSVYALNPISREMMFELAEEIKAKPIQHYDLRDLQEKLMREIEERQELPSHTVEQEKLMRKVQEAKKPGTEEQEEFPEGY